MSKVLKSTSIDQPVEVQSSHKNNDISAIITAGDIIESSDPDSVMYSETAEGGGYYVRIGEQPSIEVRDGKRYVGYDNPKIVAWSKSYKDFIKKPLKGVVVFIDREPQTGDKIRVIHVGKSSAHGLITA